MKPPKPGDTYGAIPSRGFDQSEFLDRTTKAQAAMQENGIDALWVMTEPEFRYFTGYQSQFWESPTRPWHAIIPSRGKPHVVVPSIGANAFENLWVEQLVTWDSPNPANEGVSVLVELLTSVARTHKSIGVPMGLESMLRMSTSDFERIRTQLGDTQLVDATPLIRAQRSIKSGAEINKIRHACQIASSAFEQLGDHAESGMTERDLCRSFKSLLLHFGADSFPYVMGSSGPGGYKSIIMGPCDRKLASGDVMIIDTGATWDGYFCDFDRNFAVSRASDETRKAYDTVFAATEAGFAAARPGNTTSDLYAAMANAMANPPGSNSPADQPNGSGGSVGRLGHGLGMQLTEWPSNMPGDNTELQPGMVLTLEPGNTYGDNFMMVHEEDIVITETGASWLSRRAPAELPILTI